MRLTAGAGRSLSTTRAQMARSHRLRDPPRDRTLPAAGGPVDRDHPASCRVVTSLLVDRRPIHRQSVADRCLPRSVIASVVLSRTSKGLSIILKIYQLI